MTSLLDAVTEAIRTNEDVQGDVLVTGFVVLAAFVAPDGVRHIYTDTMDEQRAHETLGLLAFGTAVETGRVVRESDE